MSGDLEDHDQYTPTIDDHLTKGKVCMSSVSTIAGKTRYDAAVCPHTALAEA
jgi:hypothetical protein